MVHPTFGRHGTVRSDDGTLIGYRAMGSGPGVILVQGAMGTAENYLQLAMLLAPYFAVYVADRRGRGMSPCNYNINYTIQEDVNDVACLQRATGAHYIFGLSSGAMIALESLRQGLPFKKGAVFEPPFYQLGIDSLKIQHFNREIADHRLASALTTAVELVGLGPPFLTHVPRILRILVATVAIRQSRRKRSKYASLPELLPAMRFDFNVVEAMNQRKFALRRISVPILLMGGDASPPYLKQALADLASLIPNAHLKEFSKADHSAPWNSDCGGRPSVVSEALRQFFLD